MARLQDELQDGGDWPGKTIKAVRKLKEIVVSDDKQASYASFNRALLALESDKRNPFDNHKISGGKGSTSDRLPFSRPMLDSLDAKPLRPTWVRIPPPPPIYKLLI